MARTNTTSKLGFDRSDASNPSSSAIFDFNTDEYHPGSTRIILPEQSTWSPGPHWHERHVEYFRVLQGRVTLIRDGAATEVTPRDGPQKVDKFVVHNFMRADAKMPAEEKEPGEVITEEWTDPNDGLKHVFFRNLFSTLSDTETYWRSWTYLQLICTSANSDDFIEFVPGRLSYVATHAFYAAARIVCTVIGLRPWYEEYTPHALRAVAAGGLKGQREA